MSYHRAAPAAVPGKPMPGNLGCRRMVTGGAGRPAAPAGAAVVSESATNPFNPPSRHRGTAYDAFTSDVPATRAVMKPGKDV
ncbi:hypothetical protein B1987_28950 [Mycobacterium kansasii]|uniref:hypothetical protein n=1 Tax=Mycobacterium attenuatum TaxID=2341086 RepID=UPI000A0B18E8|nr:hypothetical protein [Mycobacterium attenuatum]ORB82195.1 hypothetical protein B1987_28950 [Mycobacterium kansasii]VBA59582.1 hypothetical protein LAUMK191_05090 [Mycobacterium attenuatum]